jgi:tight adherence protein C
MFEGIDIGLVMAALGGMVCIGLLAYGARTLLGGKQDEVIERLERGASAGMDLPTDERETARSVDRIASILRPFAKLVKPTGGEDLSRLNRSLIHAGYRNGNVVEIFLGVKLMLPPIAIVGLWQINSHLTTPLEFPADFALATILCAIAFFMPNMWLSGRIKERQAAISDALPDAMDLMVTCVEAGLALDAAMARVGQELELVAPILAQELKQTLLEIQAGVRRSDAFHRLSNRTGVEDLRTLSAMIIQTEMFGTSVSRALRVHSDGMRTKRMQRAEEQGAMVSVKMTVPLIICILPSLMTVVIGPAAVMIINNFAGK